MRRHLFEVTVQLASDFVGPLFTGKLVKSLLIDANPALKQLFEKEAGNTPKLIHVTPLYSFANGKVQSVYSRADRDGRVNEVSVNGVYKFYVGFVESDAVRGAPTFDGVYSALMNISGTHSFLKHTVKAELIEAAEVDVEGAARRAVELLKRDGRLRITFASPTLLRDPLRDAKYKSLMPTPMNVFSTPAYVNLYLRGELNGKAYLSTLLMVHRVLNETYSAFATAGMRGTVQVVKVKYEPDKEAVPAIVGYVNMHLNWDYYERYSRRADVDGVLSDLLSTALALGTGTSRAAGFGHVTVF